MSKFIVGLTGGIGSGKTAVSDCFAKLGVDIIDADICARQVVIPGSPALTKIADYFGADVLLPNGELNRALLRKKVFSNDNDKHWLDNLLHPQIRQHMLAQIASASSPYCILTVPLLLENNMQSMVNRVLVIDVPPELQIERVKKRDDSDQSVIEAIMNAQIDRKTRLSLADDIIDNQSDLDTLHNQVATLHQNYLLLAAQ